MRGPLSLEDSNGSKKFAQIFSVIALVTELLRSNKLKLSLIKTTLITYITKQVRKQFHSEMSIIL